MVDVELGHFTDPQGHLIGLVGDVVVSDEVRTSDYVADATSDTPRSSTPLGPSNASTR